MKKRLLVLLFAFALSCSKHDDSRIFCYECQLDPSTSDYSDVGCMTSTEYDNATIKDVNGDEIDKLTKCRKK